MINQKTARDCGVCALAMAMNTSYTNIIKLAEFADIIGLTSFEMCNLLTIRGFEYKYLMTKDGLSYVDGANGAARTGITQKGLRSLLHNSKAVLIVENDAGGAHAIFYDGYSVRDPARDGFQLLGGYKILEAIIVINSTGKKNVLDSFAYG